MFKKNKILMDLNASYSVELSQYEVLKKHFDKIDADINRNDEEEQLLNAVKRREDFAHYVIFRAASNIQKIYRGKRDRQIVAKLKSKKSKKGKGKGKKGK
jgi:hypothetical protein